MLYKAKLRVRFRPKSVYVDKPPLLIKNQRSEACARPSKAGYTPAAPPAGPVATNSERAARALLRRQVHLNKRFWCRPGCTCASVELLRWRWSRGDNPTCAADGNAVLQTARTKRTTTRYALDAARARNGGTSIWAAGDPTTTEAAINVLLATPLLAWGGRPGIVYVYQRTG
jgi:hypothetical protein